MGEQSALGPIPRKTAAGAPAGPRNRLICRFNDMEHSSRNGVGRQERGSN